jgi:hypothetical protein
MGRENLKAMSLATPVDGLWIPREAANLVFQI